MEKTLVQGANQAQDQLELFVKRAVSLNPNQAGALRRSYEKYPEKIRGIFEEVRAEAIAEGRTGTKAGCSVEDNKKCTKRWNEMFAEEFGGFINHQSWADFRQKVLGEVSYNQDRNGNNGNGNGSVGDVGNLIGDLKGLQALVNKLNTVSEKLTDRDIVVLACMRFGKKVPKKFRELVPRDEPIDTIVGLATRKK